MRLAILFILFICPSVKASDVLHAPPQAPIPMMHERLIQCNKLSEDHIHRLADWAKNSFEKRDELLTIQSLNFITDLVDIRKGFQKEKGENSLELIDKKLLAIFANMYVDSVYYLSHDHNVTNIAKLRNYFKNNPSLPDELATASESFFQGLGEIQEAK